MIDHVGFGVADYERSKEFYGRALAPLGIELLMEPIARAAGFGRDGKPFFWIEGDRPARTGLHVAFACESRDLVDAFHEAALAAGGTDNGPRDRGRSTTSTTTAPTSSIPTPTTSRRSVTGACSARRRPVGQRLRHRAALPRRYRSVTARGTAPSVTVRHRAIGATLIGGAPLRFRG